MDRLVIQGCPSVVGLVSEDLAFETVAGLREGSGTEEELGTFGIFSREFSGRRASKSLEITSNLSETSCLNLACVSESQTPRLK